ncbi:MAG: DUF892 family protein [Candidatus Eremiobacteraeota bacterium]|nr:DUF892 family protein [Candidatus Eremiobacteraeota bacterium]
MADDQHSITTYLSDMLALERHILIPFQTQLKDDDFSEYSDTRTLLTNLGNVTQRHIEALDKLLKNLGGHEASPIKSTVSAIEGFFAGAIDMMRKTKVSKALRDDYTALSLCCAGYTMLNATANAMGSTEVAELANRHLRDYAQMVMAIAEALPAVVVQELQDIGLSVETGTIEQSVQATQAAWRPSGSTATVTTATTG